jgi:glucose/arabinose dehydrogenase
MNPDGSDVEVYAEGVRNTVGFTWHPTTGDLWFTDNGRDVIGGDDVSITDNSPPCELNRAPEAGMHFGYPYIHAGVLPDPEFGEGHNASDYTSPAQRLGPHVAPLGLEFYTGDQFPVGYRNQIILAEHGSWNRQQKIGYRLALVTLYDDREAVSYTTFADGWLDGDEAWGRPVDLEIMPDGSMLVSDDTAHAIYRITYSGD